MHIVVLAGDRGAAAWLSATLAERLRLPLVDLAGWSVRGGDVAGYPDGFVLDAFGFDVPRIAAMDGALDRHAAQIDLAVHFTIVGAPGALVDHYIGRIVEVDGPIDADAVERGIERIREAFAAAWHF